MPTQYTLILTIDRTSLSSIVELRRRIIIARPSGSPSGKPDMAWLSLWPWESNTITWTEDYAIYASLDQVRTRATIYKMSTTDHPATDGVFYHLNPNGTFGGTVTQPPVPLGSYGVINKMPAPSPMTFGLAQSAMHNTNYTDLNPISAQAVPYNQSAIFTPHTTVRVWLEKLDGATVLADVNQPSAVATFGGSVTTVSLDFDPDRMQFVTASGHRR